MDCAAVILAHEGSFRIGRAAVHPATREIELDGKRSLVEPRVMQFLVALHRAQGDVVTKDELVRQVWDERIVGEDAINRVVSRLRQAATKQAGDQFRIETITKVGYRLLPAGALATASSRPAMDRRKLVAGGAAATLAAGAAGWSLLRPNALPAEARILIEDAERSLQEVKPEQNSAAVGMLRRAAQLAPSSPKVLGLLAVAYMRQARWGAAHERSGLRARGMSAARQALALDSNQPDARAALIYSRPLYRNWLDYERACLSARRNHADHLELMCLNAELLAQVGRFAELLPLAQKAIRRAPLNPYIHMWHAVTLNELGRLDEAETGFERAFGLWPRHNGIWFSRFYFLLYNQRQGEALAMVRNSAKRPTGIPDWNFDLAELQAQALAEPQAALVSRALDAWEQAATRGTGFTENAAIFAAAMGDLDRAFRIIHALYFNRGFAISELRFAKEEGLYSGRERYTYFLFWRTTRPLRRDPRFALLTRELGLDDYWRRTGTLAKVAGMGMVGT